MSGVLAACTTSEITTGTSAKTLVQLVAPSAQRLRVRRYWVAFDGISPTAEPIQVRLLRQTTAGTASSLTPVAISPAAATVRATAQYNASAEPTAGDVLDAKEIHPQAGYDVLLPPDLAIEVPESGRLALEVTAPAAVNARAGMWWEE